jgi:hypothetical protein
LKTEEREELRLPRPACANDGIRPYAGGHKLNWLGGQLTDANAPAVLGRSGLVALLLTLNVSTAAHAQISVAGTSSANWIVLTVAPDGGWGTATDAYINEATSRAIARCRAMSTRTVGCGARLVSIQGGWALASRCGKEDILATGETLLEATKNAHRRELELRKLYHPNMPSCGQLVIVGPDGSIKEPQPPAVPVEAASRLGR